MSRARRLQPPLSPGAAKGARADRPRRGRRADVPPRPLRTRRPASVTTRNGGPSPALGRRRVDRSRRASHRSRAVGFSAISPRWRDTRPPTSGRCRWTTTRSSISAPRPARPPGCTRVAPSGKTCSPSRSTDATASCTSKVSAAVTESSGLLLQDAAGDGAAGNDDLGVSARR